MSEHDLDTLREEISALDRQIITAAARRNALVRQIAEAKTRQAGGRPLFDRSRERQVYERARSVAEELGLPPQLARQLMQLLVESSHQIQERISQASAVSQTAQTGRRFLIVGGKGRMGRLLHRELTARGHQIDISDIDDNRDRAKLVREAEITVIAVPMEIAAPVTAELGPHIRPDALLCDINSLKQSVCDAMQRTCRGEAAGLHPMFGSTVHSLRRQKVVVCPVRPGPLSNWLQLELGQMGLELIETDPVTHDRMMSIVQVLVHFSTLAMGRALLDSGVTLEESLRYTSPIYRLELAFIGRLFAQNADLYAEILMTNPHGEEMRTRFREAADVMDAVISRGDREEFRRLFASVTEYFHGFAGEAMDLSDFIIDALVMRP